jgi:hypothetical protein
MKLTCAPGVVALIAGMAALPVASQAALQSCAAGKADASTAPKRRRITIESSRNKDGERFYKLAK